MYLRGCAVHVQLGTLMALFFFVFFSSRLGVPEQAQGGIPLGFDVVVEDKRDSVSVLMTVHSRKWLIHGPACQPTNKVKIT